PPCRPRPYCHQPKHAPAGAAEDGAPVGARCGGSAMTRGGWLLAALLLGLVGCSHAQTRGQAPDEPGADDEDLKTVKTVRNVAEFIQSPPKQVSGVGLVTGLEGTGGSPSSGEFRQMLEAQLQRNPQVR